MAGASAHMGFRRSDPRPVRTPRHHDGSPSRRLRRSRLGLLNVSAVGIITGSLVTAGTALIPDAGPPQCDHRPLAPAAIETLCAPGRQGAGGHRHGTHSIIGIAAFIAVAWVAGLRTVETDLFGTVNVGAGILSVLLVAFAAKALKIIPDSLRKSPWAVGLAVGTLIALFAPEEQGWFPIAMGVGVVVHILGDMTTTGGCNLTWPVTIKPPKVLAAIPVVNWMWHPTATSPSRCSATPGPGGNGCCWYPSARTQSSASAPPWSAWARQVSPPWPWRWACPPSPDKSCRNSDINARRNPLRAYPTHHYTGRPRCTCTDFCSDDRSLIDCTHCKSLDVYDPWPVVGFGCGKGCDCGTPEQQQAADS